MKCRCYASFVRDDSRRNQDWSDIEIRSNFKSQRMLLFEKLSSCIVTYLVDKCKIWNFISTLLPRLIIVQSLKWFARSTNNCIVVRLVKSWSFSGCEFCERDSVGVERRKINKKGHCVVKKGSLIQPSRFCNDYSSTDSPYWSFTGKEIERLNIVLRNLKDFQDSLGFPSMERFHSGYRTCRIF